MKLISIVLSLLIFTLAFGCNHEKEKINISSKNCDSTLTYSNGIKTIIDVNCAYVGCHVAGMSIPDLTTYDFVKNNIEDITYRAITNKTMPKPAGMTACNITKLNNWIKAGMAQ